MAACKANDQSALGGIPGVDGGVRASLVVSGSRAPLRGNRADSALELFSNYKAPTVSEAKRGPGRTGRPVRSDARDQCRPPSPTMKTGDGGRRYPAGGTRAFPSLPGGRGLLPVGDPFPCRREMLRRPIVNGVSIIDGFQGGRAW